jgi:hypothetical protein
LDDTGNARVATLDNLCDDSFQSLTTAPSHAHAHSITMQRFIDGIGGNEDIVLAVSGDERKSLGVNGDIAFPGFLPGGRTGSPLVAPQGDRTHSTAGKHFDGAITFQLVEAFNQERVLFGCEFQPRGELTRVQGSLESFEEGLDIVS